LDTYGFSPSRLLSEQESRIIGGSCNCQKTMLEEKLVRGSVEVGNLLSTRFE
jgi:hypothetical protein